MVAKSETLNCVGCRHGEHQYRFLYPDGDERRVIAEMAHLARHPDFNFDWRDAQKLRRRVIKLLKLKGGNDAWFNNG